jgi:3'(2'), 5'-bisphosphate nucleotidase
MFTLVSPETRFAIQAVRQASSLVQQVQSELVSEVLTKDDRSPVTVADFASQALVGYLLAKAYPDDPLVAEEEAGSLGGPAGQETLEQVSGFVGRYVSVGSSLEVSNWIERGKGLPGARFWTLDPIDGTKGYLRGDQYAIALALVLDGQVQIGVLGCPNLSDGYRPDPEGLGSLVVAVRGQGAWTASLQLPGEFERLHVSSRGDPSQARLLRSFESDHTNVDQADHLVRLLGIQVPPLRLDSQAKYAILAAGKGDLIVRLLSPSKPDYREKIWDQAAGSLIVEEAGGKVTDLDGRPLDFTRGRTLAANRGLVASNGILHEDALRALQTVGA